jgi:hypothetical protein
MLEQGGFLSIAQAREVIEAGRIEYNRERTHSSLGALTRGSFQGFG